MTRARVVTSLALGLVVGPGLVGCSAPTSGEPTTSPTPAASTPSADGTIVVPVDEPVAAEVGTGTLHLTVEDISVIDSCPSRGLPTARPTFGHFVVLDVTAMLEAPASPNGDEVGESYAGLGAERFRLIDSEGSVQEISSTEASWSCFEDAELLPPFLDAGETVSGLVVLDSATEHGSVVFRPGPQAGWEWTF